MPRTRQPIRKRGPRLKVGWFLNLIGRPTKYWNVKERFGMTPQEFQRVLYDRANYVNEKFVTDIKIRSQCEGDFLAFRVIGELP